MVWPSELWGDKHNEINDHWSGGGKHRGHECITHTYGRNRSSSPFSQSIDDASLHTRTGRRGRSIPTCGNSTRSRRWGLAHQQATSCGHRCGGGGLVLGLVDCRGIDAGVLLLLLLLRGDVVGRRERASCTFVFAHRRHVRKVGLIDLAAGH